MADLTAGKIPKATAATVIGDSMISDDGATITVSVASSPILTVYSTGTGSEIDLQSDAGDNGIYFFADATKAEIRSWGAAAAVPLNLGAGDAALTLTADLSATFAGPVTQRPAASQTPANNGDLVVQATSNTQITFKLKGSDGVVRSGSITLA